MSWVLVVLGFAFLIVVHEGGHFVAAKAVGMRVERFFLFFPPKLVSKRIGETEYGIGAIPLGGFVKITGMNPEELEPRSASAAPDGRKRDLLTAIESADSGPETPAPAGGPQQLPPELLKRAYYNQPVWKRIVVIGAGPAVNILLAFVILFAISFGLPKPIASVDSIEPHSPAASHLQRGDRIVAIDGESLPNAGTEQRLARFAQLVASHKCPGRQVEGCRATTPVKLAIRRDGRLLTLAVTPRYDARVKRTRIGFSYGSAPWHPTLGQAVDYATGRMWFVTSRTVGVIGRIFEPKQREQLHSIVGTSDVAHQAIGLGAREALFLLAVISLSLGLINLFPFLPLDGGHIFWSLVEKLRGSRVPFSVMERAGVVGFALVLMLFVIGLTNDVGQLTGNGFHVR